MSGFQMILKVSEWIKLQLLGPRILACSWTLPLALLFTPFIPGAAENSGYELWVNIGEKHGRGGGPVLEGLFIGAGYT